MNTALYSLGLEQKLINNFKKDFYRKIGYYPIVFNQIPDRAMSQEDPKTIPLMNLHTLSELFTPFLPKHRTTHRIISLDDPLRVREIVELRFIFCHLARCMNYTFDSIGDHLAGRDHTTIIYNVTAFNNLNKTDNVFQQKYLTILNHIKDHHQKLLNESSILDNTDQTLNQS